MEEVLRLQAEAVEETFSCTLLTTSSRGSICA
jgi:hypothetical protein